MLHWRPEAPKSCCSGAMKHRMHTGALKHRMHTYMQADKHTCTQGGTGTCAHACFALFQTLPFPIIPIRLEVSKSLLRFKINNGDFRHTTLQLQHWAVKRSSHTNTYSHSYTKAYVPQGLTHTITHILHKSTALQRQPNAKLQNHGSSVKVALAYTDKSAEARSPTMTRKNLVHLGNIAPTRLNHVTGLLISLPALM